MDNSSSIALTLPSSASALNFWLFWALLGVVTLLLSYIGFRSFVGQTWKVLFLWRYLRQRGYKWIDYSEALGIFVEAGHSAFRLPPAAEAELLPGFKRDAASLVRIARILEAQRKNSNGPHEANKLP